MPYDAIETYKAYAQTIGNRLSLYQTVAQHFHIQRALYPGSHIDIAPSLAMPDVTYIDSFKGAIRFFKETSSIHTYIENNKLYKDKVKFAFHGVDYHQDLDIEPVDLIMSLYAGFVGQATKKYLKPHGILLSNDSHGDATLAHLDPDFRLVGVINGNHRISTSNLNRYFVLPKDQKIDIDSVKKKMKPPKYVTTASYYIFEKQR